jgi:hypothetical protein
MAIDFPNSPALDDIYTVGSRTWTWTGSIWDLKAAPISANSVSTAELASGAVTTAKIATGAVSATELASNSVTTAKITDSNVTTAKIANGAVTADKIAPGAAVSNIGFTPSSTGKSIAMSIVFGG